MVGKHEAWPGARIGALLAAESRDVDAAARLGGEEFVVLLPDNDLAGADAFIERVRLALAARDESGLPAVCVSAGILAVTTPSDIQTMLQRADSALYAAKRAGRDQTVAYPTRSGVASGGNGVPPDAIAEDRRSRRWWALDDEAGGLDSRGKLGRSLGMPMKLNLGSLSVASVWECPLADGHEPAPAHYHGLVNGQRVPGGVVHKLPGDLRQALITNATALAAWKDITPLARNEFICWVEDAKQGSTRERRIRRTEEELEEGQRRPCCWPGCKHRERTGR